MNDEVKFNWFDRFLSFFSAKQEAKRTAYRSSALALRRYQGAAKSRRTSGWKASGTSANAEIEGSIKTLRNRARQLIRDNPYAASGARVIENNIVGRGIVTQIKVDSNQKNNRATASSKAKEKQLNQVWTAWARTGACSFDGRMNFAGIQSLCMRSTVESGEVIIRKRRTGTRTVIAPDGNPVAVPAFSLQVLESDYLDSNQISSPLDNGNFIIQGIEFDKNGKRVAYHLHEEHPGETSLGLGRIISNSYKTVRVPAEEVIHLYRTDRPGQVRGVTWYAPVMIRLNDFDEYEDAQLLRQKIAACFAVFIKDIDGIDTTMTAAEGELGEKLTPGLMEFLPPGKDVEFANPPGVENYAEYQSAMLHAIASGLGITYESLTGDYSQVNFSSARMGFLEMNRNIESWRMNMFIPVLMQQVLEWFREELDLIGINPGKMRPVFTAPGRDMIDPAKEIRANIDAVRAGFITHSEVLRKHGFDPEHHFDELSKDREKINELGLVLDSDAAKDSNRTSEVVE